MTCEQATTHAADIDRLTADLFIALDGFAASEDCGPVFGYSGPDLKTRVAVEIAKPQVLLMGAGTSEVMAPMTRDGTGEMNRSMNDLPKVVVSQALKVARVWQNAQRVSGDVEKARTDMKAGTVPLLRSIGSCPVSVEERSGRSAETDGVSHRAGGKRQ